MKTIIAILSLCLLSLNVQATLRTWTGGGGNNKWSTPGNWSPSGTPNNGDQLNFTSSSTTTSDDISGLRLDKLFVGNGQTITGTNLLVLTNGIVCGLSGGINEVAVSIQLAANQSFICQDTLNNGDLLLISKSLDLAGYNLTLESQATGAIINFGAGTAGSDGRISGTGDVNVNQISGTPSPAGNVQFSGNTGSYAINGTVRVYGVTRLTLKKTGGFSINDRLEIDPNSIVHCEFNPQFAPDSQVVVQSGGQLLGGGETHQMAVLDVRDGANVDSEGGQFVVRTNLIAYGNSGVPVISGSLVLSNSATIDAHTGFFDLDIPAAIVSSGNFSKIGPGVVLLRGANTFGGTLTIADGQIEAQSATAFGSTGGSTILGGGSIRLTVVAIGNEPLIANASTNGVPWIYGGTSSSWAGHITLNTDLRITSTSGTTTLSGVISGSGGLDLRTGTTALSGGSANTFAGATTVFGGSLFELNKTALVAAVSPSLVIGGSGAGTAETRWLNNYQLPSLGAVTLYTSGLANLNGFLDQVFNLTFNGGHIDLGPAGDLTLSGTVTVNPTNSTALIDGGGAFGGITLSANVIVDVADGPVSTDLQIDSGINGSLGFTKMGAGLMTLGGNNTFTGQAVVQAGVLTIDSDLALGATSGGTVVSGDGTLELRHSRVIGAEPLTLNNTVQPVHGSLWAELGDSSWAGNILLSSDATVRVESADMLTLSGVISGSGQLTVEGGGTLRLTPSTGNTYANTTTVNAGTLELHSTSGNSISGPLIVGGNSFSAVVRLLSSTEIATVPVTVGGLGSFDLNGFSDTIGSLTLNAGAVTTGVGTLTLGGDLFASASGTLFTSVSSTISGNLSLGSATRNINVPNNAISSAELLLSANVSGSAGVGMIKIGTGTMRLSGNNTFTGSLTVNTGAVVLASSTALGAAGGGATVNNTASLQLDGGITVTGEPLTLNTSAASSLVTVSGAMTWNGTIALAQDSTINVNSNSTLRVLNGISGPGSLTKIGPATLTLGGSVANTYAGGTFVNEGTLVLSNTTLVEQTITGPLTIGDGVGGANADVVRLAANSQISDTTVVTINSSGLLDLAGNLEVVGLISGSGNIALGTGTLAVTNATDVTFSGVISGPGNISKRGSGKLILAGNNIHTGTTSVTAGNLAINGSQPQSPVSVFSGGTLGGSGTVGNINVNSGGTVAPGNSPGILTCSNVLFSSGSTFVVELNGTNAGTNYDLLNVRGSVSLGSATLNARLGFQSAVSNTFTIILNDGTDAVTGTFAGLAQNATVNISGIPFKISYTNGTGNDVVLTQLLPLPTLNSLRVANTNFVFSWPSNYVGFTLESNTNLNTSLWATVIPAPVISGTNYVVTNNISVPQKFFRLRSP